MTLPADEEMESDNLSILDIQQVIFTGQILERQRDRLLPHGLETQSLGVTSAIAA